LFILDESDGLNYAYALNKIAIVMRALGFKEDCLATHEHCLDIRLKLLGNLNFKILLYLYMYDAESAYNYDGDVFLGCKLRAHLLNLFLLWAC
jgi:hypothetical protein